MSANPVIIRFPGCRVRIWHGGAYTETVFPDGTVCPALPEGSAEQAETARTLGYGDDDVALCREHEIMHTLLSGERGLPHSPTLWDVAHGAPDPAPWYHYEEEADVMALQWALNTGRRSGDPYDRLEALARELELDDFLARARALLRDEEGRPTVPATHVTMPGAAAPDPEAA